MYLLDLSKYPNMSRILFYYRFIFFTINYLYVSRSAIFTVIMYNMIMADIYTDITLPDSFNIFQIRRKLYLPKGCMLSSNYNFLSCTDSQLSDKGSRWLCSRNQLSHSNILACCTNLKLNSSRHSCPRSCRDKYIHSILVVGMNHTRSKISNCRCWH